MTEPRAWIVEPTGRTPTLAWMCRECWAGGGNLNEAAPHSVSTKHAVQFERIDESPVASGADAVPASAPSTVSSKQICPTCGEPASLVEPLVFNGTRKAWCPNAHWWAVKVASPALWNFGFGFDDEDDGKAGDRGDNEPPSPAPSTEPDDEIGLHANDRLFASPPPAPSAPDLSEPKCVECAAPMRDGRCLEFMSAQSKIEWANESIRGCQFSLPEIRALRFHFLHPRKVDPPSLTPSPLVEEGRKWATFLYDEAARGGLCVPDAVLSSRLIRRLADALAESERSLAQHRERDTLNVIEATRFASLTDTPADFPIAHDLPTADDTGGA